MVIFSLLWIYATLWQRGLAQDPKPGVTCCHGQPEFKMTEKGSTCADELFIDVPTEQECFKALTFANETQKNATATYQGLVSKESFPGGCFIYDDGRMFFNNITTNVNDEHRSSRNICPPHVGTCWNLPETTRSICKQGCLVDGRVGDGTRQGDCDKTGNVCYADGICRLEERKCDDKENWCSEIDPNVDCHCSSFIQNKCPGSCDTCSQIPCEWSAWTHGSCSATCGSGTKNNTRVKIAQERNGGKCQDKTWEIQECNERDCPVDCEWSEWAFTSCSVTCGSGFRDKSRFIVQRQLNGGKPCDPHSRITETCDERCCPEQCCTELTSNPVSHHCVGLCIEVHEGKSVANNSQNQVIMNLCRNDLEVITKCTVGPPEDSGYSLTDKNKLCLGNALNDLNTCKDAASQITESPFGNIMNDAKFPKGCYLIATANPNDGGKVYFNTHATGSKNSEASQICKGQGCKGVKDQVNFNCESKASRCTDADVRKRCPSTCRDCKARNFTMSKFGASCRERGKQSIDSEAKCKRVKESLGAFETFYTEQDGFWPKGCYAAGNAIFWNNHPIGKANKIAREICHYSECKTDNDCKNGETCQNDYCSNVRCPVSWIASLKNCYKLYQHNVDNVEKFISREHAANRCKDASSTLASITSDDEQSLIGSLTNQKMWIGGKLDAPGGRWTWDDGRDFLIEKYWSAGDKEGNNGLCNYMYENNKWGDANCTDTNVPKIKNFVCKKTRISNEVCATDEFKCKTGGCKWNGPNDCHPSSTCIPKAYRCDINNEEDCTDGSDEIGCTRWEMLTKKHCSGNAYGGYSTLEEAQSRCMSDLHCSGVYDDWCDGADTFKLCNQTSTLEKSSDSCVHGKQITCRLNEDCPNEKSYWCDDGFCNSIFPISLTLLMDCGCDEASFDSLKPKIEGSIAGIFSIPTTSVHASYDTTINRRRSIDAKTTPERRSGDASIIVSIKPEDPDQEAGILNVVSSEDGRNNFKKDMNVNLQGDAVIVNSVLEPKRINTYPGTPVDCEWSSWVVDDCSKNCGNGTRTKHRTKTLNESNGGICNGTETEDENCNTQDCAGIGYSLTAKDELCGTDLSTANATVDKIQLCQEAAEEFDLPFKATTVYYTDRPKGCYLDTLDDSVLFNTHSTGSSNSIARQICKPDAIDCEWSEWVSGRCSETCGDGIQTNTRTKTVKEEHGGVCPGEATETNPCNQKTCPVACVWGDWKIGDCSTTCGDGERTSTRKKLVEEEHDGMCSGNSTRQEACNDKECPVDCEWTEWVAGVCSKTCGEGTRTLTRIVETPADYDGEECTGSFTRIGRCNDQNCEECSDDKDCSGASDTCKSNICKCGSEEKCTKETDTCSAGQCKCGENEECKSPETCALGKCVECITDEDCFGASNASDTCISNICHCGTNLNCTLVSDTCTAGQCKCGENDECLSSQTCSNGTCNEADDGTSSAYEGMTTPTYNEVDCQWSPWTLGQCSKTCGDGSMTKTRTQEISAANGGDECEGPDSLDQNCNVRDCPVVNGGWSKWHQVGTCNRNCVKQFKRFCNRPAPGPGGRPCSGSSTRKAACGRNYIPPAMKCKKWTCAKLAQKNKCGKKFNQAMPKWCYDKLTKWYQSQYVKNHCQRSCKNC